MLRDLRVEAIAALPPVEVLTVGELRVEASSLRALLAGRFERLDVRGLDARLVPAPIVLSGEPLPFTAGELVLEPATIRVASAEGETTLELEGTLRLLDGDTAGTLTFRSPELELAPILALASPRTPTQAHGHLDELAGEIELGGGATVLRVRARRAAVAAEDLDLELSTPGLEVTIAGGRSELDATSTAARVHLGGRPGSRRVDLGAAGIRAVVTPGLEPGALHVEIVPQVSDLLAAAEISGDWDPDARRLLRLAARVDGLRLEALLGDRGIEGDADLELHGDGERLSYALTVRPLRLADPGTPGGGRPLRLRTPGARLTVAGEAAFPELGGAAASAPASSWRPSPVPSRRPSRCRRQPGAGGRSRSPPPPCRSRLASAAGCSTGCPPRCAENSRSTAARPAG